jgi:hypothetical protein
MCLHLFSSPPSPSLLLLFYIRTVGEFDDMLGGKLDYIIPNPNLRLGFEHFAFVVQRLSSLSSPSLTESRSAPPPFTPLLAPANMIARTLAQSNPKLQYPLSVHPSARVLLSKVV